MPFLRYFAVIVGGALVSSALGGLFAYLIATISPEFVRGLMAPYGAADLTRYAIAMGMIWGLFLGSSVMGFSLLLATAVQVARLLAKKSDQPTDG